MTRQRCTSSFTAWYECAPPCLGPSCAHVWPPLLPLCSPPQFFFALDVYPFLWLYQLRYHVDIRYTKLVSSAHAVQCCKGDMGVIAPMLIVLIVQIVKVMRNLFGRGSDTLGPPPPPNAAPRRKQAEKPPKSGSFRHGEDVEAGLEDK